MQLKLSICSFVLVATASVNATWTFTYYKDSNYQGESSYKTSSDNGCFEVESGFTSAISSFAWKSDPETVCALYLHGASGCPGEPLVTYNPVESNPSMPQEADDKTVSFYVSCTQE